MSVISLDFMQRFIGNMDTAIKNYVTNKLADLPQAPTIMSQSIYAGDTTATFTGIPIDGVYKISICTSIAGVGITDIDDSTQGEVTVTFEAQTYSMTMYLILEEYDV